MQRALRIIIQQLGSFHMEINRWTGPQKLRFDQRDHDTQYGYSLFVLLQEIFTQNGKTLIHIDKQDTLDENTFNSDEKIIIMDVYGLIDVDYFKA